MRGDAARVLQTALASLPPAQLDQAQREYWRSFYDFVTIRSASFAQDEAKGELRLSMQGDAKLEWDDGWLYVPDSSLAFEPDFERPAGPNRDAPWSIAHPAFSRTRVTIRLSQGFPTKQSRMPAPVRQVLAGVEYSRSIAFRNGVFTLEASERSLRPEVPYSDALAARARLKALYDEDIYLRIPRGYRPTEKDIEARSLDTPGSADAFVERGAMYLEAGKFDEAIADFTRAHELNGKSVWPLANRGVAHAWKREFEAAEKDFAAAEKIEPDNRVLLRGLGFMAGARGNYVAAVDHMLSASQIDYLVLGRAEMLHRTGRTAEAGKIFAEQRAKAATWEQFNALCWRKATAGMMLETALADCREALKLSPDKPQSSTALRWCC